MRLLEQKCLVIYCRFSVGILRYLCRERDVPDHWYPRDSKKQAKVDEYLEWQHLDTRLNCAMFFQQKVNFTYSVAQQPLKSFDLCVMRDSLSNSILITLIFY